MSYPYDNPALSMNTIWNSGSYTPDVVVRNIRDNYTPINKNAIRNSIGQQISLVQNFVNSKKLGREELPIESGYITNLLATYLISENTYCSGSARIDGNTTLNGNLLVNNGDSTGTFNNLFVTNQISEYFYVVNSARVDGTLTVNSGIFVNQPDTTGVFENIVATNYIGDYSYITNSSRVAGNLIVDSTGTFSELGIIGNFGCNNATPTGIASYVSGTDAAAITAIKQILINNGFMTAS